MSVKERRRVEMMSRVRDGKMRLTEASKALDLGYRQTCRVCKRYKEEGDKGLVHRSRGQPSNRRKFPQEKETILGLYQEQYPSSSTVVQDFEANFWGFEVFGTTKALPLCDRSDGS